MAFFSAPAEAGSCLCARHATSMRNAALANVVRGSVGRRNGRGVSRPDRVDTLRRFAKYPVVDLGLVKGQGKDDDGSGYSFGQKQYDFGATSLIRHNRAQQNIVKLLLTTQSTYPLRHSTFQYTYLHYTIYTVAPHPKITTTYTSQLRSSSLTDIHLLLGTRQAHLRFVVDDKVQWSVVHRKRARCPSTHIPRAVIHRLHKRPAIQLFHMRLPLLSLLRLLPLRHPTLRRLSSLSEHPYR